MSAAAGKSTARPNVSISRKRVKPRRNFLFFNFMSTSEGTFGMPSEAYTWMCQTVSRARKKMSRIVNWSIALLLSRSSPVIVFAPASDFNYLTAVPWPRGLGNDPRNHTKSHEQCRFVWFRGSSSMPGRSQNRGIGTLLPPAFLLFCVRAYRIFKDEEVFSTPPLLIHSTAITLSALIILFLSVTCLLSFCNGRSFAAKLRDLPKPAL